MSSIIMRRPQVAESESQHTHGDSEVASERISFALPQRSAGAWLDINPSSLDLDGLRPHLGKLVDLLMSSVMLGGVFAVPVATLVALCGMLMPASQPLHHTAPMFFAFASFWFMAALVLSHFQQRRAGDAGRGPA